MKEILGKIGTWKVHINITQHAYLVLPSLAVFFTFLTIYRPESVHVLLLLLPAVLNPPYLLFGALSFLLLSEVAAWPLACWMEEYISPWFYSSFCANQAQHSNGLLISIKHLNIQY